MLALITATSDRPAAFELCERWMERAITHYGQPIRWIVIDDGETPAKCTMGQTVIRREPSATTEGSFRGNITAGLTAAQGCEKALFIEDDEWYSPAYLTEMSARLDRADVVGESRARYYSIHDQRFWIWNNDKHASLAQTGIRGSVIPALLKIIEECPDPFIDRPLWALPLAKELGPHSLLSLGIKGMPGKDGFTDGHRGQKRLQAHDHYWQMLAGWIGADAEAYKPFSMLKTASIVIPCKGRLAHLMQTLPHSINQELCCEIIVVDYGCPDGTAEQLQHWPGVRTVRAPQADYFNLSHARNIGINAARSHWCIVADADVIMPPDYVSGLLKDCIRHDWELCCAATNGAVNAQCCVSRSAWERVRGYDEAFEGWGYEDCDFYGRLEAANVRTGKREDCGLGLIQHSEELSLKFYQEKDREKSSRRNSRLMQDRGREVNPVDFGRATLDA